MGQSLFAVAQPPRVRDRLTADCELRIPRLAVVLRFCVDLEEAADRVALDAEADHPGAVVDLLDRLGRDEAPPAREEARADGEGVRCVGSGAVHGALDASDEAPARICDQEALGGVEVVGESAHVSKVFPAC